ncbi:GTP 3',8-cyclase MoaA [Ramlibacter sp.]|uniref:GTP 3',8-cyclase MoaA n=1 Tax=Ramlibacter sp. TaxID=1917967 RepID=UPI002CD6DECB|nr:GTP 3',8-cyclase MoaA [Ramlibacter sp.]HWI80527.1 GTP 3',8-cyclase MoaA [Ramlibacter sp.]
MAERVIPLVDQRVRALAAAVPARPIPATGTLRDQLGRPLRDLRISVTDRCNFRCNYCMPKEVFGTDYPYLPHAALLTFEEIARVTRQFVAHGVRKIRLTGGEPLLRKNIESLIEQLAVLRTVDGQPLDLTLTTNGSLLARKAKALKAAGLQRVTVSLDGLDDAVFRRMNDVDFPVADVLKGIDAARDAGLGPVKINMVVKKGTNDHEILPMARHFKGTGLVLRFIEYMDVGATNGWRMDEVLPSAGVVQLVDRELPLVQLEPSAPGETAERWGYADGSGEIGVISSVTQAFCGDCNRARLSTEGQVYLCLFASRGHDLRALIRGDASRGIEPATEEQLASAIGQIWQGRSDRYSQLRATMAPDEGKGVRRVEMSYIGG